jgi:hypothetical protein
MLVHFARIQNRKFRIALVFEEQSFAAIADNEPISMFYVCGHGSNLFFNTISKFHEASSASLDIDADQASPARRSGSFDLRRPPQAASRVIWIKATLRRKASYALSRQWRFAWPMSFC